MRSLIYRFPDSIKNKKTTVNCNNKKDNKRFQYTMTVALDHEEVGKHPKRITKIMPFSNKYNLEITHLKKMIGKN